MNDDADVQQDRTIWPVTWCPLLVHLFLVLLVELHIEIQNTKIWVGKLFSIVRTVQCFEVLKALARGDNYMII